MIAVSVSFKPLADARVQDLDRRVTSAAGDAISRGLDDIAATARANVAALRDPGRPSASPLAESIQSRMNVDGLGGAVQAGGSQAPYAVFIEFGTMRSPAQPFLAPALAANAVRIRADIATALNAALGGRS